MVSGINNNQNNGLLIDRMHFMPNNDQVFNPGQVKETSLKKYLPNSDIQEQQAMDSYASQGEMAAMPMRPEQVVRQAASGIKSMLIMAAALLIGGTIVASKKARGFIKVLFTRKPKMSEVAIPTPEKLKDFATKLFDAVKIKNIHLTDIKPVKMRMIGKETSEVKESLQIVNKLAKEYSHCKEGVPQVVVTLKEGTKPFRDELTALLKEGKPQNVHDETLAKIESIELTFLKKGKVDNELTNIDFAVRSRQIKDMESADWLDKKLKQFGEWFKKFNS